MSQILYALVVLQGTRSLLSAPATPLHRSACSNIKGPYVACFAYDPGLTSWSAFFKLPDGAFRRVSGMPEEAECKRYIAAFKDDVPAACRQLAMPVTCPVACVAPSAAPGAYRINPAETARAETRSCQP